MKIRPGPITAAGLAALLVGVIVPAALADGPVTDPAVLFREQIRPVLVGKCLTCHGADKKKGRLDLSWRRTALVGGKHGPAIVPGKAADSFLIERITEREMPPQDPLSPRQIAAFRQWIAAGAPYIGEPLTAQSRRAGPDWWAFQPIRRPPVPHSRLDTLASNPIDLFLFAKLDAKGLRPAPPASRLALLRRVTFDLTGLPPTPEEVDAFLADKSADAYERVVDRLLASPAYGERWGRHWLDVVRFGESNGYEQNHLRPNAWPYRDYVIRAFNEDRPFDRFILEQLAGDVLASGDPAVEAATGFLVAGVHDTVDNQTVEGKLQQRSSDLDDMVGTVGATFLGLTVGCARCHDHKFDPIPQKDYYRLTAVFAGVRHGERALTPTQVSLKDQRHAEQQRRQIFQVWAELVDMATEARTKLLKSQGTDPVPRPAVHISRNVEDFTPVKAKFVRLAILATQKGDEPCLDELEVYGAGADNLALAERGAKASASSVLPGYAIHQISHLNDGKYGNDWSWISNERGRGWAQIELPRPEMVRRVIWSRDASIIPKFHDRLASRYKVEVSLDGRSWQTVSTGDDRAPSHESIPHEALFKQLRPEQQKRWRRLSAELARLVREVPLEAPTVQPAYAGQFSAPDPVFLLKRGDVMQPGEPVAPGALSELPGVSPELPFDPTLGEPGRRLALARWIADRKNPLTARVLVNRVWHYHFGRGIVATPSDFGFNGQRPTHPHLLDWLAADFMAHGWRLKHLHRLIVTSTAYRQASAASPEALARDAGNELLSRMPLRRLEAEALRDAILSVSDNLSRQMGGPGFRLFKYSVLNVAIYEPLAEQGPQTWRRAVYRQQARAIREDLMASFDCPECAQRTPRRDMTTTPLQALSLLNGTFAVEQAKFFAERVQAEVGDEPEPQVERTFRLAFGRSPTTAERDAALALVDRRGLTALCRALLNANEFLYY
jgi:mono/diheme cytochrome c family protein